MWAATIKQSTKICSSTKDIPTLAGFRYHQPAKIPAEHMDGSNGQSPRSPLVQVLPVMTASLIYKRIHFVNEKYCLIIMNKST